METELAHNSRDVTDSRILRWLKALTGSFTASLTELEAAGMPGAAAQSLALGNSVELAAEGLDRVKTFGARVLAQDDADYP